MLDNPLMLICADSGKLHDALNGQPPNTTNFREVSQRQRLARWLSRIFHPFLISIITLVLVIYLDGFSWMEAIKWTAVATTMVILPVTMYLVYRVKNGRYSDWNISVREQRYSIYTLAGACFVALTILFIQADAPPIALACIYAALLTITLAAGINRFLTKVSIHSAAMAGCATVIALLSPPIGFLMALTTVAVGWSRVQLNQHTVGQVMLGWSIAVVFMFSVFHLYLA